MEGRNQLILTYYGHSAFLWESPQGVKVLIDPYRNRRDRYWFLRHFPSVDCHLGLITHAHFDHDASDHLDETVSILRMAGEFQYQDVSVKGVQDIHSAQAGRQGMKNVMYRIEMAGIRFLHIGDNRAQIPSDVYDQLGAVDVLMVTVDDACRLLEYEEIGSLVDLFAPRVIIPMHYRIPALTTEESPLMSPEGWLATQGSVRALGTHSLAVSPQSLPTSREVWVMEASPQSFSTLPQERED